jgi:hypothetical protein
MSRRSTGYRLQITVFDAFRNPEGNRSNRVLGK